VKHFLQFLVVHQNSPVEDAEDGIADDEGQQVVPDKLEDAALPDDHQVDETLASLGTMLQNFFLCNFFRMGRIFAHDRPTQNSLIFQVTPHTYLSRAPEKCSSRVGSGLARKH